MTRLNDRLLLQLVEDRVVLCDQSTGVEITYPIDRHLWLLGELKDCIRLKVPFVAERDGQQVKIPADLVSTAHLAALYLMPFARRE